MSSQKDSKSLPSQAEFLQTGLEPISTQIPSGKKCTICTSSLNKSSNNDGEEEEEVVRVITCGQCYFHKSCATAWFTSKYRKRGTCPNDRRELFLPNPLSAAQIYQTDLEDFWHANDPSQSIHQHAWNLARVHFSVFRHADNGPSFNWEYIEFWDESTTLRSTLGLDADYLENTAAVAPDSETTPEFRESARALAEDIRGMVGASRERFQREAISYIRDLTVDMSSLMRARRQSERVSEKSFGDFETEHRRINRAVFFEVPKENTEGVDVSEKILQLVDSTEKLWKGVQFWPRFGGVGRKRRVISEQHTDWAENVDEEIEQMLELAEEHRRMHNGD